jgi:phosphoribosylanthranilate isomerase
MKNNVLVKICGITNYEDAKKACDLGAFAIGFVFYKKSQRYIEPEKAKKIIEKLPKNILTVGVFVNEDKKTLEDVQKIANFKCFQLHGNETIELCHSLKSPVIKAFSDNLCDYGDIKAYLIDAKSKNLWGGTGELCDWELAKRAKKFGKLILSGGLNPENISTAINEVKPYAVDVSSGVEKEKGKKDFYKLESFFKNINKGSLN